MKFFRGQSRTRQKLEDLIDLGKRLDDDLPSGKNDFAVFCHLFSRT